MQPEQPNTPLEGASAPDGAASESASDESRKGSSPGWWSRLFNRPPAQEATSEDEEQSSTGGPSAPPKLTQEELDRRVQAETDRREAQRIAREKAEARKRLRDEDPWAYAQQEREAEQAQQQTAGVSEFFAGVGAQHDRASIDPVMEALPLAERERIMKINGAGVGLEGRKLVVSEALKSLEKHWKEQGEREAESRLRRNNAFRKQLLAEARGQAVEPELLPASGPSAADRKVATILRDFYGVGGARRNSAG